MLKTYNDLYIEARRALKDAGVEAYSLEARLLLASVAGKTTEDLVRDLNLYVPEEMQQAVAEVLRRRLQGEPVAYITGSWQFYGLPIQVSRDVLIPRTDTEVLVDVALGVLKTGSGPMRVLDLCTGSGCVGIAIVHHAPQTRVILVDNALSALRVSRSNVIRNDLASRVTCIQADALAKPPQLLGSFDMVVCNPPYIPTEDLKGLDSSVKDYEPIAALDGGVDGFDFYRSILRQWLCILRPGGCMLFECGAGQADAVAGMMRENGFTDVRLFPDTLGIDRVIAGKIE